MNMEMPVEEIRERKATLEQQISHDVASWLQSFTNECPVGVVGINLEFVEVTLMDSKRPKFQFARTVVELDKL